MRFAHTDIRGGLVWDDSQHVNELVVESPVFMRRILRDLANSNESQDVKFTSSGKAMNVSKEIDIIYNPLNLDFNNRRAIATLLKLLVKSSTSEEHYFETNEFKSRVLAYLDKIVDSENFTFEVTAGDFAIDDIAKAVSLHIVDDEDDFVDLLTDYMSMMVELASVKLFVFLNLRSVMTEGELARLIGNIENHQLDVMLLESSDRGKIGGHGRIVIDADLCEF